MGRYRIAIAGHGIHHNNRPDDANAMSAAFVAALKVAGHDIETATFTLVQDDEDLVAAPVQAQPQPGPTLDFGTVNVGAPETLGLPAAQNPPPAGTVINSIDITGPDAADFTPTGLPQLPYTIKGDGTDPTPTVTFTPSSAGPKSAQLSATVNGQPGAINPPIALVGSGQ